MRRRCGLVGTITTSPSRFHSETGLDEKTYIERVNAAIDAGKKFRLQFDARHYEDQVYLLYSNEYPMSDNYPVASDGNKWLSVNEHQSAKAGDGRVLNESATNEGRFDLRRGALWPLQREHGELLSDAKFGQFVEKVLKRLIIQAKNLELIAYALDVPELKKDIDSRGWSLTLL